MDLSYVMDPQMREIIEAYKNDDVEFFDVANAQYQRRYWRRKGFASYNGEIVKVHDVDIIQSQDGIKVMAIIKTINDIDVVDANELE